MCQLHPELKILVVVVVQAELRLLALQTQQTIMKIVPQAAMV